MVVSTDSTGFSSVFEPGSSLTHRCERVRVLRGVTQPLSLQPVDSHRCIVLCQRELRIYDLDSCALLARLKGVMNQKMPYFGLHDQSHLVALSRNRYAPLRFAHRTWC